MKRKIHSSDCDPVSDIACCSLAADRSPKFIVTVKPPSGTGAPVSGSTSGATDTLVKSPAGSFSGVGVPAFIAEYCASASPVGSADEVRKTGLVSTATIPPPLLGPDTWVITIGVPMCPVASPGFLLVWL